MPYMHMVSSAYYVTTIPFHWDDYAQQSFDDLEASLSNAPLISAPDYNR
jgi:hypothetical protein